MKWSLHRDGRDNFGFYKTWWEHHQPTCDPVVSLLLLKIHFARNRNNFSTANTYLVQNQKAGQQQRVISFGKHRKGKTHSCSTEKSHRILCTFCTHLPIIYRPTDKGELGLGEWGEKCPKNGRSSTLDFRPRPLGLLVVLGCVRERRSKVN
jgi:hypothetical protein